MIFFCHQRFNWALKCVAHRTLHSNVHLIFRTNITIISMFFLLVSSFCFVFTFLSHSLTHFPYVWDPNYKYINITETETQKPIKKIVHARLWPFLYSQWETRAQTERLKRKKKRFFLYFSFAFNFIRNFDYVSIELAYSFSEISGKSGIFGAFVVCVRFRSDAVWNLAWATRIEMGESHNKCIAKWCRCFWTIQTLQ